MNYSVKFLTNDLNFATLTKPEERTMANSIEGRAKVCR